jgi:hypothetical protein
MRTGGVQMNQRDDAVIGVPGPSGVPGGDPVADTERLLNHVQQDIRLLDELNPDDQVPVFERLHTTLADALARTADTAPPPGRPGA